MAGDAEIWLYSWVEITRFSSSHRIDRRIVNDASQTVCQRNSGWRQMAARKWLMTIHTTSYPEISRASSANASSHRNCPSTAKTPSRSSSVDDTDHRRFVSTLLTKITSGVHLVPKEFSQVSGVPPKDSQPDIPIVGFFVVK